MATITSWPPPVILDTVVLPLLHRRVRALSHRALDHQVEMIGVRIRYDKCQIKEEVLWVLAQHKLFDHDGVTSMSAYNIT
jgi:hypothetical protein